MSPSGSTFEEFGRLVAEVEVSGLDEAGLQGLLVDVRLVQRCLDGLVARIGVRSNQLAALGQAAPAEEMVRAGGAVGARQARRESTRAATVASLPVLGEAMSTGAVSGEHVDSLARHMAKLPEEQHASLDTDELVTQAAGLPVETFDRLVKRRVAACRDDHGLVDTEAARASSEFRHWFDAEAGMGRFAGALDPERYQIFTSAVDQHMAAIASAPGTAVTKSKNLAARALVELVCGADGFDARRRLPSITVLVDYKTATQGPHPDSLRQTECGRDLAHASIDRLCCDAVIRRVTLDHNGVPINVGRKYRTATDAQWAAIKAIHSTCGWDGCAAPINWCQAHHVREWDHHGPTDLDNLVPLCSEHHHRVHEGRWRIKLLPDRSLEVFKPDGTHHTTVPPPRRC